MKKALLIFILGSVTTIATAQTTVIFKPGPEDGQDAVLFMYDYQCAPTDNSLPNTPEILNFGNSADFTYFDWTFNQRGCSGGTGRSIIRFSGLNSIPPTATILSAELRLFGPATYDFFLTWGNSNYPGTPFSTTNVGWLKRVLGTSSNNWNESTVTWQNQPLADPTTSNWIALPISTTLWNWNFSVDVTNLVQQIVSDLGSDPYANNGFIAQLQDESYYRSVIMASSDHADSALWPELEVTYMLCAPSFTYTLNTFHPYQVTFNANNTNIGGQQWSIDGTPAGTGASLNYLFPGPGNYQVCLYENEGKCQTCINVCLAEHEDPNPVDDDDDTGITGSNPISNTIFAVPNPTQSGWNIIFNCRTAGIAHITLYDLSGKKLYSKTLEVELGENVEYLSGENLSGGLYIVELNFNGGSLSTKLIKN